MTKASPAEEITSLFKKYPLHGGALSRLDTLAQASAKGGDAEKFEEAKWMHYILDECWSKMQPEDHVRVKDLLAEIYEDLGNRGNAVAMRYAACTIANGAGHQSIERNPNGYCISVKPDFARAAEWARKAEALGDDIAAKIRPGLEEDARRAKKPPQP
jgi:hypothetical protein